MLTLILILTALTVALFALSLLQLRTGRDAVIGRLNQMQPPGQQQHDTIARRRRQARSERLLSVLQALGQQVGSGRKDATAVRLFLIQAGFADPRAVSIYWASRVGLAAGLPILALFGLPLVGFGSNQVLLAILYFGAMGWIGPAFYVRRRLKARQKEVQLALPDMLDMLVVCVEAGLGLNQALVRVADEIEHVSTVMAEQLAMVNLEMRAGTPREEALKNLADRTGVADIRSLVSMMIQTDRFGTSVADALRVHSDTMRTKRRQRAEEAAAKTTIKLVFPLVLLVFPAMFVVVIGPSALAIFRTFSKL
jgi:tight adherence protein C